MSEMLHKYSPSCFNKVINDIYILQFYAIMYLNFSKQMKGEIMKISNMFFCFLICVMCVNFFSVCSDSASGEFTGIIDESGDSKSDDLDQNTETLIKDEKSTPFLFKISIAGPVKEFLLNAYKYHQLMTQKYLSCKEIYTVAADFSKIPMDNVKVIGGGVSVPREGFLKVSSYRIFHIVDNAEDNSK